MQLYNTIQHEPLKFPASPEISPELRDLLTCLLQKDPETRITMPQIFRHPWVTLGANLPLYSLQVSNWGPANPCKEKTLLYCAQHMNLTITSAVGSIGAIDYVRGVKLKDPVAIILDRALPSLLPQDEPCGKPCTFACTWRSITLEFDMQLLWCAC